MTTSAGTEITEFKENEGLIGKSFKCLKHKTHNIFAVDTSNIIIIGYSYAAGNRCH